MLTLYLLYMILNVMYLLLYNIGCLLSISVTILDADSLSLVRNTGCRLSTLWYIILDADSLSLVHNTRYRLSSFG